MSFRIHLERAPVSDEHDVHPLLTGYLATLHDEDDEETVYVGFLAPHDLVPSDPGELINAARLAAWLVRGIAIHDEQTGQRTGLWLGRAVGSYLHAPPVIVLRSICDVDPIPWPPRSVLANPRALAEADLASMELNQAVDAPDLESTASAERF